MRVQGDNGIKFELEESIATGMIAAGLLSAIDEDTSGAPPAEGESQPPVDEDPKSPEDEDAKKAKK